jgi:hypothetical protein
MMISTYHLSDHDLTKLTLKYLGEQKLRDAIGRPSKEGLDGNQLRSYNKVYQYLGYLMTRLIKHRDKEGDDFVDIPREELRLQYRDYVKVNRWLEGQRVLEISHEYIRPSEKILFGRCKGYRLKETELPVCQFSVIESEMEQEILKLESDGDEKEKVLPQEKIDHHTYRFLKEGIKIDIDDWRTWKMDAYTIRSILLHLRKLDNGLINMGRSDLVKRLHHTLTNMPSEGRRFIKFKDGRKFAGVDIGASHLTQMVCLYDPDAIHPDGRDLQQMILDDLYMVLSEFSGTDRSTIKRQNMKCLYGLKGQKEIDSAISALFPNTYTYLQSFSGIEGYLTRADRKKEISHVMMELESDLVTREVASRLIARRIDYYTIHDSVYVAQDNVTVLKTVINNVYKETFGYRPRLKVELL